MIVSEKINNGKTALGIEFGSTRIKAVLIDENHVPLAAGAHTWENRLDNGIWTYCEEDIWSGLHACYRSLAENVKEQYGVALTNIGSIGFSAMMHGYMAFDYNDRLLVPYRTWRNTITGKAADELTALFQFTIPQRWSIAHLYQAILNDETHVKDIAHLNTLSGYVHYKMTGRRVLGVGDASGMFPIDSATNQFDSAMLAQFEEKIASYGFPWRLAELLPDVLTAGENAGYLTEEGARLLDETGKLKAGIPLCPPEGDAGTGMVATNSVAQHTGNVSAGTSVFAMAVLEKALSKLHPEIDMVTTPHGRPVAMVHCNNCTSDINAWVQLFGEMCSQMGLSISTNDLYDNLFRAALKGESDCGGLFACNYYSGESITDFEEGRPIFARKSDSNLTLGNFMRAHLYASLVTLKLGMNILTQEENVILDRILGHGGLFKTPGVGQQILASAINTPVSVMETASEGGAWGMAILAAFAAGQTNETLEDYLEHRVFANQNCVTINPNPEESAGFAAFTSRYVKGLAIERAAIEALQ